MTLLEEIDAYLARTGMSQTAFCDAVGNDNMFITHLRRGSKPTTWKEDAVRAFMAGEPQPARLEASARLPLIPTPSVWAFQCEMGSASLLRALLRYGLRNDRDLGMGREAFLARCREHGVAV